MIKLSKDIKFSKFYKKLNFLSLILIIFSVLTLIFKGLNLGVDFKGGTLIELRVENNKIFIEVMDNGIGISKEKINKIFEPYFTTKNKGTGLGLSIVKKIIDDHNGKIRIEKNTQMAGTTSTIIFDNLNA